MKFEWQRWVKTKNTRKTHEELLLRFFALFFDLSNYEAPMKHFLNIYMNKNRKLLLNDKKVLDDIFNSVFNIVSDSLEKDDICLNDSRRVNTQLLDSILVGIANNIKIIKNEDKSFLSDKIKKLKDDISNEKYDYSNYWESRASQNENVKGRCEITTKLFGN